MTKSNKLREIFTIKKLTVITLAVLLVINLIAIGIDSYIGLNLAKDNQASETNSTQVQQTSGEANQIAGEGGVDNIPAADAVKYEF
jgi:hypothetical protein